MPPFLCVPDRVFVRHTARDLRDVLTLGEELPRFFFALARVFGQRVGPVSGRRRRHICGCAGGWLSPDCALGDVFQDGYLLHRAAEHLVAAVPQADSDRDRADTTICRDATVGDEPDGKFAGTAKILIQKKDEVADLNVLVQPQRARLDPVGNHQATPLGPELPLLLCHERELAPGCRLVQKRRAAAGAGDQVDRPNELSLTIFIQPARTERARVQDGLDPREEKADQ